MLKMPQFLLFLLLLLPSVLHAQSTLSDEQIMARLANISNQPEVQDKVMAIFQHDERQLSGCEENLRPEPLVITVFSLPRFSGDALHEGRWQVRYNVQACGKNRRRTAFFEVQNGEDLSIISLLPGDTLADMALQADTRQSLFMSGIKLAPQCQTPQITHTQVIHKPKTATESWQEIWTADFCGKKMAQTITFQPNDQGTAFSMTAVE